MPEMKSLTLNDTKYDGFVDPVARAMGVINSASGGSITVSDASHGNLVGLNIFGKTTQDGTPTPDAPVDLVSVGNDGNVEVKLYGENIAESIYSSGELEQYNSALYIETTLSPSTTYTLSFRGTTGNAYYANEYVFEQVNVTVQNGVATVVLTTKSTLDNGIYSQYQSGRGWVILKNSQKNSAHVFSSVMLNLGTNAKEYEAPKGKQTLSVSTPNGLQGIPVTSGGNYTDANGQQWICDEIDFARGVYIQRCYAEAVKMTLDETNTRYTGQTSKNANAKLAKGIGIFVLSDTLPYHENAGKAGTQINGVRISIEKTRTVVAYYNGEVISSVNVLFPLETPIETPLSEEELAAYAALHTYKDHTTVSNDAGAWMDLEYVMDSKKYIDSLIKEPPARLSSVTLLASKWAGSNSLYSQVVTIPGITEYSKVDLLPSVEQLAIFFNKNVSFVTENEDGVVTVYAIGDKPTLDYTMQVQITEVEV